jgi:hypothetical protein
MRISIRNALFACLALGVTVYGITVLRGSYNMTGGVEKRRQIDQLELENQKLHSEIESQQNYLADLKQNPEHLKLVIEDRLKLVSPGTKHFILQDGTTSPTGKP